MYMHIYTIVQCQHDGIALSKAICLVLTWGWLNVATARLYDVLTARVLIWNHTSIHKYACTYIFLLHEWVFLWNAEPGFAGPKCSLGYVGSIEDHRSCAKEPYRKQNSFAEDKRLRKSPTENRTCFFSTRDLTRFRVYRSFLSRSLDYICVPSLLLCIAAHPAILTIYICNFTHIRLSNLYGAFLYKSPYHSHHIHLAIIHTYLIFYAALSLENDLPFSQYLQHLSILRTPKYLTQYPRAHTHMSMCTTILSISTHIFLLRALSHVIFVSHCLDYTLRTYCNTCTNCITYCNTCHAVMMILSDTDFSYPSLPLPLNLFLQLHSASCNNMPRSKSRSPGEGKSDHTRLRKFFLETCNLQTAQHIRTRVDKITTRGRGLGSSTIFKKFHETYAPS